MQSKGGKKEKSYTIDEQEASKVEESALQYQASFANPVVLLSSAKKGLQARAALDFLALSGFTYDEFQETFKTTVKTVQNYAAQDLNLDAPLSEKLLKSFALFKEGILVFGSVKAFRQWLYTPAHGLGNLIPFSIMDTVTGLTLITEEVTRIAYGDLA